MWNLKNIIKRIVDSRGWTIKDLANKISMSEQNLYKCFKRNSIMTSDLLDIAKVLGVHPKVFFEDDYDAYLEEPYSPYSNDKYLSCLEELNELNRENRDLNKKIKELEDEIRKKKTPIAGDEQKTTIGNR